MPASDALSIVPDVRYNCRCEPTPTPAADAALLLRVTHIKEHCGRLYFRAIDNLLYAMRRCGLISLHYTYRWMASRVPFLVKCRRHLNPPPPPRPPPIIRERLIIRTYSCLYTTCMMFNEKLTAPPQSAAQCKVRDKTIQEMRARGKLRGGTNRIDRGRVSGRRDARRAIELRGALFLTGGSHQKSGASP